MSISFRPVKETWYEGSSLFVDHDTFLNFVERIAHRINSQRQVEQYGELTAIWIEKGSEFLRCIMDEEFYTGDLAEEQDSFNMLVHNMRMLAHPWMQALDTDNSLRFYVD